MNTVTVEASKTYDIHIGPNRSALRLGECLRRQTHKHLLLPFPAWQS